MAVKPGDRQKQLGEGMRQEHWSEIDDTRRIERMRQEVKHLQSQNAQLIESVRTLLTHVHKEDGTPLVPIEPAFGSQIRGFISGIGGAANRDDVYF